MLLFSLPSRRTGKTLATTILTPAHYLRLRRTAAGLSVDAVVTRLAPAVQQYAEAAALVRMLETDGAVARSREIVDRLAAIVPLDPDVYFQIAREPADRRPHVCMGCGCSAWDPCTGSDGVCSWSQDDSCSRCVEHAIAAAEAA